ncbi:hypothetical protein EDEG_01002 [Edhazardia aedis USNM 41457]|uniref:Uncharacterized protein n=1 Tax=Edhazardia aedis (strain USNM 41457) TaxID=1003232 RepID=J9DQE4_EDHAE|nr:hypothetical protein EDEG_01002 [Edhazardia aedis USNM 41457]|eukprot:EJW04780.1 hypothetical protein EDEG_01002 [Edhazardia aedis USNM 41457]
MICIIFLCYLNLYIVLKFENLDKSVRYINHKSLQVDQNCYLTYFLSFKYLNRKRKKNSYLNSPNIKHVVMKKIQKHLINNKVFSLVYLIKIIGFLAEYCSFNLEFGRK